MSAVKTELTAVQLLPWSKTFLDYTDEVVAGIPDDDASLDWRPTDEAGGWYFSIREQAMHIADERHDVLRSWLRGEDVDSELFLKEYGGTGKPWEFKPASKAEILASLAKGRKLADELLAWSGSTLLDSSDGLVKQHEESLAKMRGEGKDTSEREVRGPGRIVNMVLFLIAHEQTHRAVLQHMLRQRGHEVVRYA